MTVKMPYKNLNHALTLMKKQVLEGIPYAAESLPRFETPEQIFNYLKLRTTYVSDPKGIELFQTLPTLLENNFHNITGAGDCDCFTISLLSVLLANGFFDRGIVLVGRNKLNAVHIYAYTDYNGERYYMDLTNKTINKQRPYSYRQEIPFILNNLEKKK